MKEGIFEEDRRLEAEEIEKQRCMFRSTQQHPDECEGDDELMEEGEEEDGKSVDSLQSEGDSMLSQRGDGLVWVVLRSSRLEYFRQWLKKDKIPERMLQQHGSMLQDSMQEHRPEKGSKTQCKSKSRSAAKSSKSKGNSKSKGDPRNAKGNAKQGNRR